MSHRLLLAASVPLLAISLTAVADAQGVRIGRGRGVIVNVPGVALNVGPIGIPPRPYAASRLRAIAVAPYGVAPLIRPRLAAEPPAVAPRYPAGVTVQNAIPSQSNAELQYPTAGELRAFDDSSLLNTLADLAAQLDADLARFSTADSWRPYLRLPADALPPPTRDGRVTLGIKSIERTLNRFDAVVANPEYVQISGLPSFAAAHAALAEVLERFAGAEGNDSGAVGPSNVPPFPTPPAIRPNGQGGPSAAGEELPTPPPTPSPAVESPASRPTEQRSILSR